MFLILETITFKIILVSTFDQRDGLQFSISVQSFPCFSIRVLLYEGLIHAVNEQLTNKIPKVFVELNWDSVISWRLVVLRSF